MSDLHNNTLTNTTNTSQPSYSTNASTSSLSTIASSVAQSAQSAITTSTYAQLPSALPLSILQGASSLENNSAISFNKNTSNNQTSLPTSFATAILTSSGN